MDPIIGCEKIDSPPILSGGVPFGEMKGSILAIGINFYANHEKKFNVEVSFDENTTKLDFKNIDYERRLEAERVAMEIEG